MNARPLVPVALKVPAITGTGGADRETESVAEPVPPRFMALIVGVNVPVAKGVPEISPVDGLTPMP